ncbi:hypothetical protein JCM7686_pAMI4p311 (plasmid) [Paracoccus aminophilus JCM 7686]|uniref:Uncharacterized protein n=2 Tax=Paracoccus aminophilus TaxID=34003 RepID=S5XU11_PARAH|nr:hypothetical protein JCM7686_pAMI4p311 [Paracoccus aminophilus JCM 7686]
MDSLFMRCVNLPGQSIPQTSQAIFVDGGGLLFVSGQVALDESGIVGGDLRAQLEQSFTNLKAVLNQAGATFDNVVKMSIYVVDYQKEMIETIRQVRGRYVNLECPPASALIGVSSLFMPGLLVEVEAIASISAVPY